jgi:hypothetical protein
MQSTAKQITASPDTTGPNTNRHPYSANLRAAAGLLHEHANSMDSLAAYWAEAEERATDKGCRELYAQMSEADWKQGTQATQLALALAAQADSLDADQAAEDAWADKEAAKHEDERAAMDYLTGRADDLPW